jgi:cell division protein FtsW
MPRQFRRPVTRTDYAMLALAGLLTVIGLVIVWSASFVIALVQAGDANYYVFRQFIGAVLGASMLIVLMRFDYRRLRGTPALILLIITVAMLALVLASPARNGAHRWLGVGEFSIQPAEFAKLTVTVYLASWLVARGDAVRTTQDGLIPFILIIGLVGGLIMLEPSLGTTMVIMAIAATMFFVAGASARQMFALIGAALLAVIILGTVEGYRMDRLVTFFGEADQRDKGFQTHQALIALGNGGWQGLGLGESRGKFFYVPESHTDGVFAVLGEETGLLVTSVVLLLYVVLILRGFALARQTPDDFGALIATGITAWIAAQTFLNIGGITSMTPLTGVPLPFMSYGNNALAAVLAGVGLLVSVSRHGSTSLPVGDQRAARRERR